MDPLTNPAFVIFAAIAPLLIAVVKQQGFSKNVNALIAFGCYIVVGAVGAILVGIPLTAENLPALVAAATVVGSAAYALVWTKLQLGGESVDATIENSTSFIK